MAELIAPGAKAPTETTPAPLGRPLVIDDGRSIRVSLFQAEREVAAFAVTPHQAITVAGDLIAAARRWFGERVPEAIASLSPPDPVELARYPDTASQGPTIEVIGSQPPRAAGAV